MGTQERVQGCPQNPPEARGKYWAFHDVPCCTLREQTGGGFMFSLTLQPCALLPLTKLQQTQHNTCTQHRRPKEKEARQGDFRAAGSILSQLLPSTHTHTRDSLSPADEALRICRQSTEICIHTSHVLFSLHSSGQEFQQAARFRHLGLWFLKTWNDTRANKVCLDWCDYLILMKKAQASKYSTHWIQMVKADQQSWCKKLWTH